MHAVPDSLIQCGWCGAKADAEHVDNGIGWQQVSPGMCGDCGAVEMGAFDSPRDVSTEERKRGWYMGPETDFLVINVLDEKRALAANEWIDRMLARAAPQVASPWVEGYSWGIFVARVGGGRVHMCRIGRAEGRHLRNHVFEPFCDAADFQIADAPSRDAPTCWNCLLEMAPIQR